MPILLLLYTSRRILSREISRIATKKSDGLKSTCFHAVAFSVFEPERFQRPDATVAPWAPAGFSESGPRSVLLPESFVRFFSIFFDTGLPLRRLPWQLSLEKYHPTLLFSYRKFLYHLFSSSILHHCYLYCNTLSFFIFF